MNDLSPGGARHASYVYVIDDDDALRAEIAETLTLRGHTVEAFADGRDFLSRHATLPDGCLVLDVNMPGVGGREVQQELARTNSRHHVVMLTGAATVPLAVAALQDGAADFIEKPVNADTLLQAVGRALTRLRQSREERDRVDDARCRLARLSSREHDVLAGLVLGLLNKIIAYRLGLSTRTVETYRAHVMGKLGVSSLPAAVRLALDAEISIEGAITGATASA